MYRKDYGVFLENKFYSALISRRNLTFQENIQCKMYKIQVYLKSQIFYAKKIKGKWQDSRFEEYPLYIN